MVTSSTNGEIEEKFAMLQRQLEEQKSEIKKLKMENDQLSKSQHSMFTAATIPTLVLNAQAASATSILDTGATDVVVNDPEYIHFPEECDIKVNGVSGVEVRLRGKIFVEESYRV